MYDAIVMVLDDVTFEGKKGSWGTPPPLVFVFKKIVPQLETGLP
jgi:hypothetical protein